MSAEIFYFSGTGNSFVVARDIGRRIGGTLIPIGSAIKNEAIEAAADMTGIVFPVHNVAYDGLPRIVHEFVEKLQIARDKYVFAVCTCGGGSGATVGNLRNALARRGGNLACGFTVILPSNVRPIADAQKRQKMFDDWTKKREAICGYITARKAGHFETFSPFVMAVFAPLTPLAHKLIHRMYAGLAGEPNLPFLEVLPLVDRGFRTDERCTGCGTCAAVCPVENIVMVDGKPSWQHHCENCVACVHWCPESAIHDGITNGIKYHHPDVRVEDMLRS